MWWAGLVVCRACGHRWVAVQEFDEPGTATLRFVSCWLRGGDRLRASGFSWTSSWQNSTGCALSRKSSLKGSRALCAPVR